MRSLEVSLERCSMNTENASIATKSYTNLRTVSTKSLQLSYTDNLGKQSVMKKQSKIYQLY